MEVIFYVGIVLFVLFGPWLLLWRVNARRKSDRLEDLRPICWGRWFNCDRAT